MATADVLLDDPDELDEREFFAPEGYEAIDGRLVEKPMSEKASWVGGEIYLLIALFLKSKALGRAYPQDTAFRCFPGRPLHIRKPDAAFVRAERLSPELSDKDIAVPPDLVVEVVSPHDTVLELDQRIADYRSVGVPLIWVVNPNIRTVQVLRADRSGTTFTDGDTLSGEDVLPGFTCKVADFLPPMPTP